VEHAVLFDGWAAVFFSASSTYSQHVANPAYSHLTACSVRSKYSSAVFGAVSFRFDPSRCQNALSTPGCLWVHR